MMLKIASKKNNFIASHFEAILLTHCLEVFHCRELTREVTILYLFRQRPSHLVYQIVVLEVGKAVLCCAGFEVSISVRMKPALLCTWRGFRAQVTEFWRKLLIYASG
jgi:hypothetical protein